MKKKFIKAIPLLGISTLALSTITGLSFNPNQEKVSLGENSEIVRNNTNFDLASLPSESNIPFSNSANSEQWKEFIGAPKIDSFFTNDKGEKFGPLSEHSLNTARSGEFMFNFITSPITKKIRIIATPDQANNHNVLELMTPYDSIDDSALFVNNQLVLIGTINPGIDETKSLSVYEINQKYPDFAQGTGSSYKMPLEIVEISTISLKSFSFNNGNLPLKYALSPINKTFSSLENSEFILWPMGITASKLAEVKELQKITIQKNQAPEITNLPIDFSLNGLTPQEQGFPIHNLTPIEIIGQNSQNILKFFSVAVPLDETGVIKLIEFFPKSDLSQPTMVKTLFDSPSTTSSVAPPLLDSVIPYAYVQQNDIGFSLFWIAQNKVQTNNPAIDPSILTRVNVSITGEKFDETELIDIKAIPIGRIQGGVTNDVFRQGGVVEQIHYGVGGNLESGVYISIRFKGLYNQTAKYEDWSSSLALIEINDKNLLGTAGFLEPVPFSQSVLKYARNSSKNSSVSTTLTNYMGTTYNGSYVASGIDPWKWEGGAFVPQPDGTTFPMSLTSRNVETFDYSWNTSQSTRTIILPSTTETLPSYDNELTIKVKDLNFSPWIAGERLDPTSILRYVRSFVEDINYDIWNFTNRTYPMNIGKAIEYRDTNNNILVASDELGKPPVDSTSAKFRITIPGPLINGALNYSAPITFNFSVIDNPGTPKEGFSPVVINGGNLTQINPELAAQTINSFNDLRILTDDQNILGTSSDKLININEIYLNSSLLNIEATGDNFLGTLTGKMTFMDPSGNLLNFPFEITGLQASVMLIPVIVGPIIVIAIIVLIIVLVLIKKNAISSKKSLKAGFAFAKSLNANNQQELSVAMEIPNKSTMVVPKTLGSPPQIPGRPAIGQAPQIPGRPQMTQPGRPPQMGQVPQIPGRPAMGQQPGRPAIGQASQIPGRPPQMVQSGRPSQMGQAPQIPGRPQQMGPPPRINNPN